MLSHMTYEDLFSIHTVTTETTYERCEKFLPRKYNRNDHNISISRKYVKNILHVIYVIKCYISLINFVLNQLILKKFIRKHFLSKICSFFLLVTSLDGDSFKF